MMSKVSFIRPSALGLAQKCAHFVDLAERFPETSEAAERGNVVDEQISAALANGLNGPAPSDPDAVACLHVMAALLTTDPGNAQVLSHEKVTLYDPDTGELLTEGTPDVQILNGLFVRTVDWKKREQYYAGYLSDPDDNLQLHAYSLATALAMGSTCYQNIIVIFGDGKAEAIEGRVFQIHEWNPILEDIRKIQAKSRVASPGSHCANCWQRWVCGSYVERAKLGLSVLGSPNVISGPLSDDQAALLVERATAVKQAAEVALDLAKAHQRSGGKIVKDGKQYVPTVCQGRESGNVELLRKDGLTKYINRGAQFDRWGWKKVSK